MGGEREEPRTGDAAGSGMSWEGGEARTSLGSIRISDDYLAELAGFTCTQCYGVVGMAAQSLQDGVAQLLGRDSVKRGVKVKRKGGRVTFHLYVIVEAGINITEVARNLIEQVEYNVRKACGLEVEEVQVHIQGVRAH